MRKKILLNLHNKRGQGMVEYGLLVMLIAIALIGAVVLFRQEALSLFESISARFP